LFVTSLFILYNVISSIQSYIKQGIGSNLVKQLPFKRNCYWGTYGKCMEIELPTLAVPFDKYLNNKGIRSLI